jgi:hypothetical protein
MDRYLYIFLDEGGNLDFSTNGTKFFVVTSLAKERPFEAYKALAELKYDLVEQGVHIESFHATEDKQPVRNKVFDIIERHLDGIRVDSVIVEKCKTEPALQEPVKFYSKMVGYLLRYVLGKFKLSDYKEVLVFTDAMPVERLKNAMQKAIKEVLAEMLPATAKYRLFHHESKACLDLQIVDYCNWAIYRKHDRDDSRSYAKIARAVKSEFKIFGGGQRKYY